MGSVDRADGADGGPTGPADLEALIAANAETERRLVQQHDGLVAASESSNADDEHDPEGSTIAFERQQALALLDQVRRTGKALRRAAAGVRDGTYGRCEVCGGAIDPERLAVRPQAGTCITCARVAGRRRP
ncbi:TraR/DksA family transcriptional regulator [Aquipuribacter sp. MA13-6]|uniref:TraR/DksA family transcriptional regulator n=1 Tax=unclassified Aquipuribacter TaxID=2635084 RepID=UPI003EF0003D